MTVPLRLCLPVQVTSAAEVRRIIGDELAAGVYDAFEIWADLLDEPASTVIDLVSELSAHLGRRLVILFRRPNLEPIAMSESARLDVMKTMRGTGAWVDLDLDTQITDVMALRNSGLAVSTILSHHDYLSTPSTADLLAIADRLQAEGADIVKVATLCRDGAEAVRLMQLVTDLEARSIPRIILGMGHAGRITRIFSLLHGNALNFAPRNGGRESAAGQIPVNELRDAVRILAGVPAVSSNSG